MTWALYLDGFLASAILDAQKRPGFRYPPGVWREAGVALLAACYWGERRGWRYQHRPLRPFEDAAT